jgi:hypothetical protein
MDQRIASIQMMLKRLAKTIMINLSALSMTPTVSIGTLAASDLARA